MDYISTETLPNVLVAGENKIDWDGYRKMITVLKPRIGAKTAIPGSGYQKGEEFLHCCAGLMADLTTASRHIRGQKPTEAALWGMSAYRYLTQLVMLYPGAETRFGDEFKLDGLTHAQSKITVSDALALAAELLGSATNTFSPEHTHLPTERIEEHLTLIHAGLKTFLFSLDLPDKGNRAWWLMCQHVGDVTERNTRGVFSPYIRPQ